MNKFLLYFQLFHNMGIKYFLFRIQYEIRRKEHTLFLGRIKNICHWRIGESTQNPFSFQVERA